MWKARWLDRQVSVLTKRPNMYQQDFLLNHILLFAGGDSLQEQVDVGGNIDRNLLLASAVFCSKPSVSTRSFRKLLRFVAGLEYFARTAGHWKLRKSFPEVAGDHVKRACLYCFVHHKILVLDSEWHSFFSCPACEGPRDIFSHCFPRFSEIFVSQNELTPGNNLDQVKPLAKIIHEARFSRHITNELSRFVTGICACRSRQFSLLSQDGPLSPLGTALMES